MKVTDYSQIAEVYDRNQFRLEEVKVDTDLENYIQNNPKSSYSFLDLACGTGIYLDHQYHSFKGFNIDWHGLDASQAMLKEAEDKVENVAFEKGLAESMPYEDESFNVITNNYAFHHFVGKEKVLDEIHRVLKRDGVYKLHNIDIYGMKNWWIYHYFPSALLEDYKRFWRKEVIFRELSQRGFDVRIDCTYQMENIKIADYLGHVENRDISVLTLIDDEEYNQGLYWMKQDLERSPEKKVTNDFSELICIARKK
ncbi:Ubiquinone/menaquinone biosynthesis C-methylase UbiE [Halobacillus dabanensis]|uniref:Ubiquinone/menaquinone biosynthesis C-methylase UbiE n=1 Tax=Halobacillus dabanensis TaxID=240302 RepID=A0A1I3Q944_HALDA|nr:class I SAM-dependent methyltransferase [Halobacillus dabanensis]SFJ30175.1 Ubiquinone/menaquinone biosynthesis C-methylase UbiE [Halobacillus dabanensis]